MSLVLLAIAGVTALFLAGYLFAVCAVFVLGLLARLLCTAVDGVCALARHARPAGRAVTRAAVQ